MVLNASFKDSFLNDIDENKPIEEAAFILKQGLAKYFSTMQDERGYEQAREKMLNFTENSIKKYAYHSLKTQVSLEPYEIDQVKKALIEYASTCEKTDEFKKQLLEDLTTFQHKILGNQKEKIMELIKEKDYCEKQIKVLEYEKHKLIMERLSKIVWPYDAKTKKYDQQIAKLQAKAESYANKTQNQKDMRPAANERDILLYKMHLREKFAVR